MVNVMLVAEPRNAVALPGDMISGSASLEGVHWDREVALVIDMGEQRTAGYGVKVTGMDLAGGDEINLQVEVTRPGPGAFVAQVLTHPHAVVRLPRAGLRPGEITVVLRDKSGAELLRQAVTL